MILILLACGKIFVINRDLGALQVLVGLFFHIMRKSELLKIALAVSTVIEILYSLLPSNIKTTSFGTIMSK